MTAIEKRTMEYLDQMTASEKMTLDWVIENGKEEETKALMLSMRIDLAAASEMVHDMHTMSLEDYIKKYSK